MSFASPSGGPQERYSVAGKNLSELLIEVRDKGKSIERLGGFSDFCARLYRLVYDEDMNLASALNELGRQSNGALYISRFWAEFSDGVFGNVLTIGDEQLAVQKLITQLEKLKNTYLTGNPGN